LSELNEEILRISILTGIEKELKTKISELSGGMKRRLSIGIALIGDTKVLILGT
jgi:ABC-type multidrug transport system ATPase subunit